MERDFLHHVAAVDFDGTLCTLAYPEIGEPRKEIIEFVKYLRNHGWYLILWTAREDELLDRAVAWCKEQGIVFDQLNENIPERVAYYGGKSCRKVGCDLYIDDLMISPDSIAKVLAHDIGSIEEQEQILKEADSKGSITKQLSAFGSMAELDSHLQQSMQSILSSKNFLI